jgi:hypothetical protein
MAGAVTATGMCNGHITNPGSSTRLASGVALPRNLLWKRRPPVKYQRSRCAVNKSSSEADSDFDPEEIFLNLDSTPAPRSADQWLLDDPFMGRDELKEKGRKGMRRVRA